MVELVDTGVGKASAKSVQVRILGRTLIKSIIKSMTSKEDVIRIMESRVATILEDSSLSKIKKLAAIEEERLWPYADYCQDEFKDWEQEAQQLGKYQMSDTIFDPSVMDRDRGSKVSYADALEFLLENQEENEDEDPDNPLITVITTRRTNYEFKKTYNEVVDKVFDYACKNKIVGFHIDW